MTSWFYKYELSRKKMWPELKVLGGIALRIGGWSLLGAAAVAAVYFLFLIPVYGKVWAAAPAYFFGGFFVTVIVLLADLALRVVHHNRSVLLLTAAVWGSFYCRHARLTGRICNSGKCVLLTTKTGNII